VDPKVAERFWAKVDKNGASGCWLWTGAIGPWGHGHVRIDGKLHAAHRLAYESVYGPVPKRTRYVWECGVRNCVRPDHMTIGGSKLTAADVAEIRASEESQRATAARFGVSQSMIANVRSGRAWKHVT
jgi:hypothetical protein